MPTSTVNNNLNIINKPVPTYYHCFKLNDSNYALFDIKMDMPIVVGSLNIIKSIFVPPNSYVFYYEPTSKFYFDKVPQLYIKIDGNSKRPKAPLRYKNFNPKKIVYHHFKLSPVLSVLFDEEFDMPLAYGSNQRVFAVINNIPNENTVFYYKEDLMFKNSFKFYMKYQGKTSDR